MLKWANLLILVILLSGCFSNNTQSVVIIDKSVRQDDTAQQHNKKKHKPLVKSNKKPAAKARKSWSIPVKASIAQGFSKPHPGLRFHTKAGQTIHAVRDGVVVYSGDKMTSHGQMIIIKHPFGFYSSYTQAQNLKVAVGDKVEKGQTIAVTSQQPFYFEMKKFSSSIDPKPYLK